MKITGLHRPRGSNRSEGIVNPVWKLAEEVNLTAVSTNGASRSYDWTGANDWNKQFTAFAKAYDRMVDDVHYRIENGLQDTNIRVSGV